MHMHGTPDRVRSLMLAEAHVHTDAAFLVSKGIPPDTLVSIRFMDSIDLKGKTQAVHKKGRTDQAVEAEI